MKFFTGLAVSAALICTAGAANAQMAGGMRPASDFDAPYAGGPPPGLVPVPEESLPPPAPRYYDRGYEGPGRGYERGYYNPDYRSDYRDYRYGPQQGGYGPQQGGYSPQQGGYGPGYGYAPSLLPPHEVYAIVRQNGFSPLGAPRQRGYTYVIAALDQGGEDGRLIIDGRNGRILRFVPASRWGQAFDRMSFQRGPARDFRGPLPAPVVIRASPQAVQPVPSVVNRSAPARTQAAAAPRPAPVATKPAEPLQKSAAVNETRAAQPAPQTSTTVGEAKPAAPPAQLKPTQNMPKVQGFE